MIIIISGRFVKQEQWILWRARRKLVVWVQGLGVLGITPLWKNVSLYMQSSAVLCIFGQKMVCNAVHNAFLNTMGTPCVHLQNEPW